ncbi:uncharacterized oxidoreductase At1g06690, chloroplastic-like, partial [Phoenix dactylifera]|uniref:Uncharacterized oxidoreductase At1g06690, chloroplastic-like n=1 Tax=Phoenix dactylifera TaxID=42345 RepID=A0A8B9A680_PHODC
VSTHVFYRKILHCNEVPDRKLKAAKAAFDASIDDGITFFDIAEVYGAAFMGAVNLQTLLESFIKERQQKESVEVAAATKLAALPWRFGRGSVLSSLKYSLSRLGLSAVDLYQLHWSACQASSCCYSLKIIRLQWIH